MGVARVSRQSVEVLTKGVGKARVSRQSVEVLTKGQGVARVSRQSVEVLIDINHVPPGAAAFQGWGIPL